MKTLYAIERVEKTHKIQGMFGMQDLKISWYDGMIGVMPVFSNRRKAEKYCKSCGMDKSKIVEVVEVKK